MCSLCIIIVAGAQQVGVQKYGGLHDSGSLTAAEQLWPVWNCSLVLLMLLFFFWENKSNSQKVGIDSRQVSLRKLAVELLRFPGATEQGLGL